LPSLPVPATLHGMQIIISAICTGGGSLREAIGTDPRLERFGLRLDKMQTPGRHPGWLKLHSATEERGAINIVWDAQAHILTARVVTRRTSRPSPIVGAFITYLLARYRTRIKAITTAVRE
jgi:hypothetical protein